MDDFDNQIEDTFHGIGQPRTEQAGAFLSAVQRACEGTKYTALTAWEQDGVNVCIEYPDGQYTASGILWISQPEGWRVDDQARAAMSAFIERVESPLYRNQNAKTEL